MTEKDVQGGYKLLGNTIRKFLESLIFKAWNEVSDKVLTQSRSEKQTHVLSTSEACL